MCFQGPQKVNEQKLFSWGIVHCQLWFENGSPADQNTEEKNGGRKVVERIGKTAGTGSFPIPSMYGIFTYIHHKDQPNVGNYTIHGSYEFYTSINALRSKTK